MVFGVLQSFTSLVGLTGDMYSRGVLDYLFGIAGLIIGIWFLVELGFLRGTIGPNQYGPDPWPNPEPRRTRTYGTKAPWLRSPRSLGWNVADSGRIPVPRRCRNSPRRFFTRQKCRHARSQDRDRRDLSRRRRAEVGRSGRLRFRSVHSANFLLRLNALSDYRDAALPAAHRGRLLPPEVAQNSSARLIGGGYGVCNLVIALAAASFG